MYITCNVCLFYLSILFIYSFHKATVQQGVDVVVENVKWLILHEKEIGDWLPKTEASTVPPTTPSSSRGMYQKLNTIVFLALILFYFFW